MILRETGNGKKQLVIDEGYIKQNIECLKIQPQANPTNYSFSQMLEYRPIDSSVDSVLIDFKDKNCDICKNFCFYFKDEIKYSKIMIVNVSYLDIYFGNLKAQQITFEKCNIKKLVFGNNISCNKIVFSNCKIETITFGDCKFENVAFSFLNCSIEKFLPLGRVEFCKNISFTGSQFLSNEKIEFFSCIFSEVNFANCNFGASVYFSGSQFKKFAKFDGATFEQKADFVNCKFLHMSFNYACFKDEVIFNEVKFQDVYFMYSIFEKSTSFKKSEFKQIAEFKNCEFNQNVNFSNCKFYADAYFNNATFKESADFHECEFEKTAVFYGAQFEKTPNFSQAIFEGNVNLVNAKLDFDFKGLGETIQKEHKATADTKSLAECANDFRDSFRLFKNALIKDNNLLDASNHHRIELYCKEIELDSKISNAQASAKELIDSCVLKFYRHTSDHHTDLVKIISCVVISIGLFGILLFGIRYGLDLKSFVANHSNNFCAKLLDSSFIVESNMIGLLYICATCALFIKEIRFIFYLCVTIYMCAIQYKNIFLIFGNLTHSNANQSAAENLLIVIYAILMFLLIFSLQKTARKNSIVPH